MTESEARDKCCPKAYANVFEDRFDGGWKVGVCIASDCMMWRWEKEQPRTGNSKDIIGYCGLAK